MRGIPTASRNAWGEFLFSAGHSGLEFNFHWPRWPNTILEKYYHIIRLTIIAIVAVAVTVFAAYLWLRSSTDPGKLIAKWVGTLLLLGCIWYLWSGPGVFMKLVSLVPAVFVGAIWAPEIGGFFASPVTSMIDGGDVAPEVKAVYSKAVALRKRGLTREAIVEIRAQLDEFTDDYDGLMMLAEIQVEDLKDLPAALASIESAVAVEGLRPGQVSLALNTLADYQLKYALDPDAARAALQRIEQQFPQTEFAFNASQRIAHLPTKESLNARHQERRIAMPTKRPMNAGPPAAAKEETLADAEAEVDKWIRHLAAYPQDQEGREELAQLYARKLDAMDRAREQYEHLIATPNVPARTKVRWLDTLATLEIQVAVDETAARAALQRIIDSYPNTAFAQQAQQRLDRLGSEFKGRERREPKEGLKLGSYERDLGIKRPWESKL